MNNHRNQISGVLVVFLLITMLGIQSFFQFPATVVYASDTPTPTPTSTPTNTSTPTVTPEPVHFIVNDDTGEGGDTVTMSVSISANSNMCVGQFELIYDTNLLEYVSANVGSALLERIADVTIDSESGKIVLAYINTNPMNSGGTILNTEFLVKEGVTEQTFYLELLVDVLMDDDNNNLSFDINGVPGEINYSNEYSMQYIPESAATATPGPVMYGDIDRNGTITAPDALLALQASAGKIILTNTQKIAADVNFSGSVNLVDVLMILCKSSGSKDFLSPVITMPSTSSRTDITVQFPLPAYVPYTVSYDTTYKVSLHDDTVNMYTSIVGAPSGASGFSTSYLIQKEYLYEDHEYTLEVTASMTANGDRISKKTFKINLSGARQTMLDRGKAMIDFTWTPIHDVKMWNANAYFHANDTQTGVPFTMSNYQYTIPSVSWSYSGRYIFSISLAGFYDVITGDNGHTGPKYGNDCSGFVSICWDLGSRETTAGLSSTGTASTAHKRVGQTSETYLKQYARLSPGDILVKSDYHSYMIKKIEKVNKANGTLDYLVFTCYEQTPPKCIVNTNASNTSDCTGFIGVCKNASVVQDYSWNWS